MARPSLTPRQIKLGLDLFTGAVVLSVAVALAGLTWRIAGHAGTGAITVPGAGRLPVTAAAPAPGTLAFQPFGQSAPGDASQPTGLALELRGLVFARPAELASAFVSVSGAEAIPVKIGDSVGGATVQAIGRDRIILLNGGRSEYLAMPDPFAAPTQPGAPGAAPVPGQATPMAVPPPPPPGVSAAAPPPNAANLLQRFNATPTGDGLRIGANAPGGLRQGDVIQSLNGQSLADPAAAQSALAAAQASGAARVDIVRNGQRVTLTVPTR